MAVLLPNTTLGVQRRPVETRDAHGDMLPATPGPLVGPYPGWVKEETDGSFSFMLDPGLWPMRPHDLLVEPGTGRTWTVVIAAVARHTLDAVADHVYATGREKLAGSTEPPAWFQPET